jgi:tripartite-type tricarboxylate transporter receptor subunit TctC
MAELGRSEMTGTIWFGYLAPSKVPKPIIDKLARAFAQIQSDPALAKRVSELGAELAPLGPVEFARLIESDRTRYGKIVMDGNLATQN